ATTAVSESDGWLRLSASGFTFSSPTIKVKLTQQAPTPTTQPSGTDQSTTVSTPVKKKTITCVRGVQKKKVQGSKCPKGFKKA
ncbi:MAG: hypothetical protein ACK55I_10605, partial [bacterium]